MKKSILFLSLIISLLFIPACSQSTNEIVCDYGTVLCDVSTTLCTQIPGIPSEVCTYLDLACYNLDQLCALQDSTDNIKYQVALSNLQTITAKLRNWQTSQLKE